MQIGHVLSDGGRRLDQHFLEQYLDVLALYGKAINVSPQTTHSIGVLSFGFVMIPIIITHHNLEVKYCDVIVKRYIAHVGSDEHVFVERKGKTLSWEQVAKKLPKVV